jgi:hypothetical protein
MFRFAAVPLFLHGLAHLVGFLGAFRLSAKAPYPSSVLAGTLPVGEGAARALGTLWLLGALAFVAAAVGVAARSPWWPTLTVAASSFSLLLCIVAWPEARIGVFANVAILMLLVGAKWGYWLLGVD